MRDDADAEIVEAQLGACPPFFLRTLEMPEGYSHRIWYLVRPDGEFACIVHQARPSGRDYWSIEEHLEGFTSFNPDTDVEILEEQFREAEQAALRAFAKEPLA